jgi:hypothetical protein
MNTNDLPHPYLKNIESIPTTKCKHCGKLMTSVEEFLKHTDDNFFVSHRDWVHLNGMYCCYNSDIQTTAMPKISYFRKQKLKRILDEKNNI